MPLTEPKVDVVTDLPATSETDVYAVHGADPEVLAYAMAKYSRSALSMKESLKEISSQRAEQFLNTFYFQYGHRSIADLAHLSFAIERLSLLAAIELVDEQRWDGQERSTRYQNFKKSGWYTPAFAGDATLRSEFTAQIEALFAAYERISLGAVEHLREKLARPEAMKEDAYERTLKARAFDVARYLLPLAANTSLGQIVNARTLETQVSRLLSSEFAEVRLLGEKLRQAASGAAWNVQADALRALTEKIRAAAPQLGDEAATLIEREVHVSPTLVKYAAPNPYEMDSRKTLARAAREWMAGAPIADAPVVDLVEPDTGSGALEIDLATSLLYPHCHFSFRQLRDRMRELNSAQLSEIIALGVAHRGRHDELARPFSAGQLLRFDILMDIGGFRDMHRHRKCIQLRQGYTTAHGFDLPEYVEDSGMRAEYERAMQTACDAAVKLGGCESDVSPDAQYLLPLGVRCRAMFKMDFAEAVYIADLRSQPQGHFSYRRVAWEMYQAVARQYPALQALFHTTDIAEPVDLLKR